MIKRGESQRFFCICLFSKFKKNSKNKKGEILIGTVVFIILNLAFLLILVLFLLNQGNGAIVLEESYAKQIALLINSAKPAMIMQLDMEKAMNLAERNGVPFSEVVQINGNVVRVRLSEKGGYSYSFFNDVEANSYVNPTKEGMYVITVSGK